MIQFQLNVAFSFDHCEIPAGTVIGLPAGLAEQFQARGVGRITEVHKAVIAPEETRIPNPEHLAADPEAANEAGSHKRKRYDRR